jgi:phosphohistidine phosphatase
MSKTLILARHSKPESRITSLKDFDRPLTREGISDTEKMAGSLLVSGIIPDFILTSSARRANETAFAFARIMQIEDKKIITTRNLYYSSPNTILAEISTVHENINCLMIIAHNPGISELSRILSRGRSTYMDNTQISMFEFEINNWNKLNEENTIKFLSFSLKNIV